MYLQLKKNPAVCQAKTIRPHSSSNQVIQCAWVGRRALAHQEILRWGTEKDHKNSHGIFHEHIFFEDGKDPNNQGFGPDGIFVDKLTGYEKNHGGYNDYHMRLAVAANASTGSYQISSNNCQHWAEKVLATYHQLRQESILPKAQDQSEGEEMREISNSSIKLDLNALPAGDYEMRDL